MTSGVSQRLFEIEARVVVVVKSTDLVARATVHALLLVHFGIKEAEHIGLHLYSIMSAYTGASRTSATVSWIVDLYHYCCFMIFLVMFRALSTTNARSFLLHPIRNSMPKVEDIATKDIATNDKNDSDIYMDKRLGIMAESTATVNTLR